MDFKWIHHICRDEEGDKGWQNALNRWTTGALSQCYKINPLFDFTWQKHIYAWFNVFMLAIVWTPNIYVYECALYIRIWMTKWMVTRIHIPLLTFIRLIIVNLLVWCKSMLWFWWKTHHHFSSLFFRIICGLWKIMALLFGKWLQNKLQPE